jgi:hypothetical protein
MLPVLATPNGFDASRRYVEAQREDAAGVFGFPNFPHRNFRQQGVSAIFSAKNGSFATPFCIHVGDVVSLGSQKQM